MEASTTNHTAGGQEDGTATNPYLVDLSNLRRPTNIRSDKELEAEVSKICETLKDTCKRLAYE